MRRSVAVAAAMAFTAALWPSAGGAQIAGAVPVPVAGAMSTPGTPCPRCVADLAVYDPSYEDDGVWEEEVTALLSLAKAYGWTYQRVDAQDLDRGALGVGDQRRFRAFVAPGGWAARRVRAVGPAGDQSLRDFVSSGGGYLGLCAGAYWAADTVVFATRASGGGGTYVTPSDYVSYAYDLDLLGGSATGPFGWTPWNGGDTPTLEVSKIRTSVPAMASAGMPSKTRFFYGGGPFFSYDSKPPGWEVWAKAKAPSDIPSKADTGDGEPTVVSFLNGAGRVVLFAYHPDILIGSKVDGVVLSTYYDEKDIDWDTGSQTMKEINVASWNIVHAAIQTVLGTPVTPVTHLP